MFNSSSNSNPNSSSENLLTEDIEALVDELRSYVKIALNTTDIQTLTSAVNMANIQYEDIEKELQKRKETSCPDTKNLFENVHDLKQLLDICNSRCIVLRSQTQSPPDINWSETSE